MNDRCQIPRCRGPADMSYLGHGICGPHWNHLMNDNAPPDALRMALGIEAEPELEITTMSKKKQQQIEQPPETQQVDIAEPEKNTKAPKAAKRKKVAKPTKKTREPKEEGLVVFAFRLTPEERDAIHKAAGPARASRFVRTIAVAAAQDDEAAIRTAIKDAREVSQ